MIQEAYGKINSIRPSRVGVIGVGNLGSRIAERLLASGFPTAIIDTNLAAVEGLTAQGATASETPVDMARAADVILLVVRTAADVEAVLFGDTGIAEVARPDLLVCIVSTVAIDDLKRIAARAAERSLFIVDAAIGGGSPSVANRTAAAMIGGTKAQYDRITEVFGTFCGDMIHVPGIGGGMRLKLIKNHLSYVAMMVGLEAATLARSADIDLQLVTRVMDSSNLVKQFLYAYLDGADIEPLEPRAPQTQITTQVAMAALCRKDLAAARQLAEAGGVQLPLAAEVEQLADRLFRVPGSDKCGYSTDA